MQQDQFERPLPTFIQLLELDKQEQAEYWEVMDSVLKGEEVKTSDSTQARDKVNKIIQASATTETRLNNKVFVPLQSLTKNFTFFGALIFYTGNSQVRLLRSMLQWEKQLYTEAASSVSKANCPDTSLLSEVLVIRWPDGEIMRMPSGSTAADAAWRMGMDGKFIFVNSQVAPPYVQLQDGDIVEVRM